MKRKLLIILILITCSIILFSKDIDRSTAEKVALNFFFERCNLFVNPTSYPDLNIVESKLVDDAYYVINFQEGWVLVSANDVMVPILGYNYKGIFSTKDQQSENFKSWMKHYVDQIIFIRKNELESDKNREKWNNYLTDNPQLLLNTKERDQVGPLLTCTWHQTYPYNIYCPEDPDGPGGYVLAGCGATAIAMIMNYWRYPIHGSGSHSYYCYPYGTQTVNFEEATYEWDAMLDNIDNENPWEIAEITYHAAVSVNMDFGPNGSSSSIWKVPNALSTYFNYDVSIDTNRKNNYSQEIWEEMIREDLDLLRPLDYRAAHQEYGGHLFVCDGYQDPNFFHFNFGWSGDQNGYYTLEDLIGFNEGQWMVNNIFPADPEYPYIAEGPDTLAFLSGSFTDGSGPAEDYPAGMDASWLIDPQTETDSIVDITLSFIQFNTASSDYLKVYDGGTTSDELLGEFSGDELPGNITSSGNKMLIAFSSTGTGAGFKAEYSTTTPTYCIPTTVFTDPSGTLSDGSGTFYYNNNTSCYYIIEHPEGVNYNIEFTSFSTEEDKDKLSIYNGDQELIGEFSGNELPDPIEETTDMLILLWSTNSTVKEDGWSFDYTVNGVGIKEDLITNNLCVIPNPFFTSTTIAYELQQPSNVQITIYNHLGRQLEVIEQKQSFGKQQVVWDAEGLPGGVYFCVLKTDSRTKTMKMIKMKP